MNAPPSTLAMLNDAETQALEIAAGYDAGTLAEALAALAHTIAYQANVSADEYRQLGSLCFIMARRMDAG
jgi:hypothetical protein